MVAPDDVLKAWLVACHESPSMATIRATARLGTATTKKRAPVLTRMLNSSGEDVVWLLSQFPSQFESRKRRPDVHRMTAGTTAATGLDQAGCRYWLAAQNNSQYPSVHSLHLDRPFYQFRLAGPCPRKLSIAGST